MIAAISVTGRDCPGIIAAITEKIYRQAGNLEDVSMTILEDEFAMILLVEFKSESSLTCFQREVTLLEKKLGVSVSVRKIMRRLKRGEKHTPGTVPYIVTVFGRDRTGIVYQVTRLMAAHGLNITGLNSRIIGRGKKAVYTLILEVDVKTASASSVKRKLAELGKQLKVEVTANPAEPLRI